MLQAESAPYGAARAISDEIAMCRQFIKDAKDKSPTELLAAIEGRRAVILNDGATPIVLAALREPILSDAERQLLLGLSRERLAVAREISKTLHEGMDRARSEERAKRITAPGCPDSGSRPVDAVSTETKVIRAAMPGSLIAEAIQKRDDPRTLRAFRIAALEYGEASWAQWAKSEMKRLRRSVAPESHAD